MRVNTEAQIKKAEQAGLCPGDPRSLVSYLSHYLMLLLHINGSTCHLWIQQMFLKDVVFFLLSSVGTKVMLQ